MSDTAEYITLLVISIVITIAVGQVLMMSGQPFLQEVFQDEKVTRSVNLLLSVLFHLITLGVLSIVSVLEFGDPSGRPLQTFVTRLGVVLVILGVAYGISMLVLIRLRERRQADHIHEEVEEKLAERAAGIPPAESGVAAPVAPVISPGVAPTTAAARPVVPPKGL
jgi:hypothetical protein